MIDSLADDASFATPFERWCESQSVRPDEPGAWEHYSSTRSETSA